MMNLKTETTDEARKGDVINAFDIAMNKTNIIDFMSSLNENIGCSKIGKGSNHIWIHDTNTNERIAIITGLIN